MLYIISAAMILFMAAAFIALGEESVNSINAEFLGSYGWEIKKRPIEKADVNIPEPFDLVYENYNKMQLAAGLDLEPYMGRKAVRYTYEVTNFPYDEPKNVRANVLCVDNEPVAGDVMTVAADGFMAGLDFLEKNGLDKEQGNMV